MLFKRIESEGLAHYSYLIGDKNEAVVIDPRRDCEVYIEEISRLGYDLKYILETHRNEDYIIGSVELAERTGESEIWHAESHLNYGYGRPVSDGQTWKVGRLLLKAIHTPGHTDGHMSYVLHDFEGAPWMIFTGDTLFAGDVGRVDLLGPKRTREMAGLLHDSIYRKILPLGDHVIVCPAHGAGSVCGAAIADRSWTTVGMERLHNPKLRFPDRDAFIEAIAHDLERPPYFRMMEKLNLAGPPLLWTLPVPEALPPRKFAEQAGNGYIIDTRMDLAFGAAHVPGSISIWQEGLPSFAGWYVPYDRPIFLVTEADDPGQAVRYLVRLGYDRIEGRLAGGMLAWHMAGMEGHRNGMIPVQSVCNRLDTGDSVWVLDVRGDDELKEEGRIPDAHHIHVTQLPRKLDDVPKDRPIHIFCGSGLRSTIGASLLKREGWNDVSVILGGVAGWKSDRCPITK